jgi:hypothetical protein
MLAGKLKENGLTRVRELSEKDETGEIWTKLNYGSLHTSTILD